MECTYSFLLFILLALTFDSASTHKLDGVVIHRSEYEALLEIKNGLIDARGFLRTWNDSGDRACSGGWAGIKCVEGHVIAIQLPWRGLGGRISEKVGQLQQLRRISLHDNVIGGTIPLSIGSLPNLRGLYLFNNRLSGSIPPSIGNCPMLQSLDLSNNSLTGVIPPSLSNSSRRIYRLNLSFNSLTGSIPLNLTHPSSPLTFLSLQNNNLSGPLPESISTVHNLSVLDLKNNRFTGPIPSGIGNLSSLQQLDLAHNNFSGEIPSSLARLTNLFSFNVSYNNLSGVVPSALSRKFDSTSFVGNLQLCGYSSWSPNPCPSPPPVVFPSPAVPEPSKQHRKISRKDIIIIAAAALLAVLLLLCCILICCLMRKKAGSKQKKGAVPKTDKGAPVKPSGEVQPGGEMGGKLVLFDGPSVFTADDLLCATAEIMGKSTYGTAYKATLEDGNQVAVKRLREKTTKVQREFEAEASELGKIRHPNLLALRAYYLGPKGEKLLVFDYMPNGSLASFLHARGPETIIAWPTRMKIALGITRGLNHLHVKENIIHGNLSSSNVLLDEHHNAHVADYGISKLMTAAANTNIIATAGTQGYRAPELSKLKNASTKTDIYSLGVIILELLTGKSPGEPTNGMDLPQWVASIVKEEWTNEVFDLELMKDANSIGDELLNTLKLALHCVDPSPSARPEAVQVLQQLEEIKPDLVFASHGGGATQMPFE